MQVAIAIWTKPAPEYFGFHLLLHAFLLFDLLAHFLFISLIGLVCLFKICVSFSSWLVLVALYPAVLFLFLKCWSAVRLAVHSACTTDFLAFIYNSSLHPFTSNGLLLPSSSRSVLQCPGFTSDACHHGSTLDSTSFGCVSVNRRPDSCSQASPWLLPPSTPVWVSVLVILLGVPPRFRGIQS